MFVCRYLTRELIWHTGKSICNKAFKVGIIAIYLFIFEKEPEFPFQYWVPNKGTTGTIFITPLVWRGPWLGIGPGISRTWSQHSTTRLSSRWSLWVSGHTCRNIVLRRVVYGQSHWKCIIIVIIEGTGSTWIIIQAPSLPNLQYTIQGLNVKLLYVLLTEAPSSQTYV